MYFCEVKLGVRVSYVRGGVGLMLGGLPKLFILDLVFS